MSLKLLVLFFTPLIAGLLIFLIPKGKNTNYKMLLVFAGSYLFGITVIHILPELYQQSLGLELIGLFVLTGFFLQQMLEYFTSGIEHGHIRAIGRNRIGRSRGVSDRDNVAGHDAFGSKKLGRKTGRLEKIRNA